MSLINKCFKIIGDDDELTGQFPELVKGVEFKVVEVDAELTSGITAVQIKNGPYIHVKGRDSWFWCLWCEETMEQLQEVEELASDQYPELPEMSNMYQGEEISKCLEDIADELNHYNGSLALHAAAYIRHLEAQIAFNSRKF